MKIICLVSFLLLSHFSIAQISSDYVGVTSGYVIDDNSTWNLTEAKHQKYKPFGVSEKVNIGFNRYGAVWCYFKLKNTQNQDIKTWLSFDNYHIDSLTLFDQKQSITIGDRTTNSSPFIDALVFEIPLKAAEEKILFVRLKKQTSYVEFSYNLENASSLTTKSFNKVALLSFFMGIAFLLLMINSILFIMRKQRLYIYYIAYSVLTVIYASITTNFAKHVLFPEFLFFSELRVFSGALWYIALSYFLTCFLQLKIRQPFKYKLILLLCRIDICLIILSIALLIFNPTFDFRYAFVSGYVIMLIAIVILFWAALAHLKIDKQQAVYALLAFAPQLIWGACVILKAFQIIPKSLGDNWMVVTSLYEVFLFGYILSRNYIEVFLTNNELMKHVILEKENSLRALTEVQLRERRNIANILHDNVGSKIAHVIHLFDMKNTQLAKETVLEMADDIREISHRILPKALDEGALAPSLRSQIASLSTALPNVDIELFCYDFPEKIDEKWVYDLYLMSLEIINNAIKHGRAKLITIEFYRYSDNYHFQYTDDGLGFDIAKVPRGFGLENMEQRINYYNGYLEISSSHNEGTIVQIDFPLKR